MLQHSNSIAPKWAPVLAIKAL